MAEDSLEDVNFEISYAMYNYYSAIGNPTRATGINRTQWRSFCNASGLSEKIATAKMDIMFSAALKIGEDTSESDAGEELAMRVSATSSPRVGNASKKNLKPQNTRPRKISTPRNKSELTFVQFFSCLHEASQHLENPTTFVPTYLFPLATMLMHKLVVTSTSRRASVKKLLKEDTSSSTVGRILKPNRKTIRKLFQFYQQKKGNEFNYTSLLAFAKDFDVVPTLISHSLLQKIMHDVKMSSHEDDEKEKEKRNNKSKSTRISQGELSPTELEQVLIGIAQHHRMSSDDGEKKKTGSGSDGRSRLTPTFSMHLDADLIKLLRHLEFGEGRRKMAMRGSREHRTSRFTSSEHFVIPKGVLD